MILQYIMISFSYPVLNAMSGAHNNLDDWHEVDFLCRLTNQIRAN